MFSFKNKIRRAAVISLVSCLFSFSSALAETSADQVPQSVINLDLCTLAYQLYHQSLCLPLDPWYGILSRVGSDRRDNICRFTHDYAIELGKADGKIDPGDLNVGFYSGPDAARGWSGSNLTLDPILSNYKQIDPKLPAFTKDTEMWISLMAPAYVTRKIKSIEGVRYRTKPTGFPNSDVEVFPIREYSTGDDHLIVFEGGTGIAGAGDPSWSLMGFVLMQKTATGYDAHIVFRGSRSGGALSKTVWKAQGMIGNPRGNPDWITDLRSSHQIEQPLISTVGKVTEGFAEVLPTMLGPIDACCKHLEKKYPAPDRIYVTGHSLGAALATQFVSAVGQGSYGSQLKTDVKSWPWDKVTLMAYAQPIPGDPTWKTQFDKSSPNAEHYWVSGDDVVEASSGTIVSMIIDKGEHAGVQNKLNELDGCKDNPHEVFVIRDALVRDLAAKNTSLSQQLAQENTWAYYDTFSNMLVGKPVSFVCPGSPEPRIVTEEYLRKILQTGNFSSQFASWLEQVYAKMIDDKSSYIGFKFQSTLDDRRKLVLDIVECMRKPGMNDATQELDNLENEFKLIDGQLGLTEEERWLYCGMILSRIEKSGLTLNELLTRPAIKACLESKGAD